MSKLKPIGSEKLKGQEQLNRMLQIAKYKEAIPTPINEDTRVEYNTKLVDGNVYFISKEKQGYIIKKGLNESTLDYIEPMKNRTYYNSYSDALKKLNLIAKELNRVHNINEGISLFTEDKKYFLKNPNPTPTEEVPMDEPAAELPPSPPPAPEESPAPPADDMDMNMPEEPEGEMPSDDMMDSGMEDMGPEAPDEDVSFKVIQKLTGKLAQKIRDFQEKNEEITSKDAKYVVNSVLSALADNLEDDDKEDIISKLEGEEEADYGMEPSGMESEEEPMDMEDMGDMGTEEEMPAEEGPKAEMSEEEISEKFMEKIMSGVFGESKVDNILSKYFVISENERKLAKEKEAKKKLFLEQKSQVDKLKIKKLSDTKKQQVVAESVIDSFPEIKFVGKTNKGNLIFEHNNKQLKVSPKGDLL